MVGLAPSTPKATISDFGEINICMDELEVPIPTNADRRIWRTDKGSIAHVDYQEYVNNGLFCTACDPGRYSDQAGATLCKQCPEMTCEKDSLPEGITDETAVSHTFQRTADLCGEVKAFLAAQGEQGGESRWQLLENELRADQGLNYQQTLGSTGGSLGAALQANELRLARMKTEIEELKDQSDAGMGFTFGRGMNATFAETSGSLLKTGEMEQVFDLGKMLNECVAIENETSHWQGLAGTPKGWKKLDRDELADCD